ncbi:trifunctional hydroxymethylpyrimidine kinase/phosphomethylpyrimidine kinase/thiaminase, variant 2 [Purpureocillium takamizusanense]|nr:trifunctional hydroxymethylpyrimidine kinase/phosphomethylpyrimidine kinase/thiaminase, variant 2 [Purpureocillium takamizusanense]UNI17253.1 trifunctional hydroxymethylpyrimidine kinase/phosphomethylpyrimidine kinase/thiaminase, variant 2 [Purpureocillium takamizusanense]
MTATTALTVQNTTGVKGIHVVPADFVERQIEACLEDVGVDVITTGMLAAAETIEAVARQVRKHRARALVVDPVMVSTSGAQLLPHEAIRNLSQHLLPLTTVLTPNIPEAKLILSENGPGDKGVVSEHSGKGEDIRSVADIEAVGRRIQSLGPEWVLVKGGHLPFAAADMTIADAGTPHKVVVDTLVGPDGFVMRVESPWQETTSTHGTGCSLAAAISSGLAVGKDVPAAVRAACRYVEAGIREAPQLGSGHGPLDHFHSTFNLPFSPGYFIEYLLDRPDVRDVWKNFVYHPFVMALGDGTLPLESFKGYIIQDYLYLIHFARANALAAYKTTDITDITRSSGSVGHIMHELKLHISYCESFGISVAEMRSTEEKQACTAYTRYVLDIGQSEDWLALQMAIAPCLLGYGAVAKMLHAHPSTRRDGNTFWPWIENYIADDYTAAVKLGSDLIEDNMRRQSPSRVEELVKIFIHALKMEIGFWEMFPHK